MESKKVREIIPNGLYDVDDLVHLLKWEKSTILTHLREGKLPGKKQGNYWFVMGEDLINHFLEKAEK